MGPKFGVTTMQNMLSRVPKGLEVIIIVSRENCREMIIGSFGIGIVA